MPILHNIILSKVQRGQEVMKSGIRGMNGYFLVFLQNELYSYEHPAALTEDDAFLHIAVLYFV
jgi:hypothetical protein